MADLNLILQCMDYASSGIKNVHRTSRKTLTTASTEYSMVNGITTFNWMESAQPLYVSSSNNSDACAYSIYGLDANWNEQTVTVTLEGQTKKAIPGTWIRVFEMRHLCAVTPLGNAYLYMDDTVVAGVPQTPTKLLFITTPTNLVSQSAVYTIPVNHTGLIHQFGGSITSKKDASVTIRAYIRLYGGILINSDGGRIITAGGGASGPKPYGIGRILPEKSDILITAVSDTDATEIISGFECLIKKIRM